MKYSTDKPRMSRINYSTDDTDKRSKDNKELFFTVKSVLTFISEINGIGGEKNVK